MSSLLLDFKLLLYEEKCNVYLRTRCALGSCARCLGRCGPSERMGYTLGFKRGWILAINVIAAGTLLAPFRRVDKADGNRRQGIGVDKNLVPSRVH
jgi:hypothetical protein